MGDGKLHYLSSETQNAGSGGILFDRSSQETYVVSGSQRFWNSVFAVELASPEHVCSGLVADVDAS